MRPNLIAFDQRGDHYCMGRQPPRKWLLEHFDRKHAEKMYVDRGGRAVHIGYVVAGHWCDIMRLEPWKPKALEDQ
jgi:hypothetical protein